MPTFEFNICFKDVVQFAISHRREEPKDPQQLAWQAMKAALKMPRRADVATEKLLQQTRQASMQELATRSLSSLAWNCSKNWEEHPLTKSRVKNHIGSHMTRQRERDFPPQEVRESLLTHMVEVWEKMPLYVKSAEDPFTFKENLRFWTSQMTMV